MSLELTRHAEWRRHTRGISDESIAGALCGEHIQFQNGSELYINPHDRTTIAVENNKVKSIYKMQAKVYKARYSR